jgi:hypothetical protein
VTAAERRRQGTEERVERGPMGGGEGAEIDATDPLRRRGIVCSGRGGSAAAGAARSLGAWDVEASRRRCEPRWPGEGMRALAGSVRWLAGAP